MTDKKDPMTRAMLDDMIQITSLLPEWHELSALTDWCLAGMYMGFRLSEYIQDDGVVSISRIAHDKRDQLPRAFLPRDVCCFVSGGRKISHAEAIAHPASVAMVSYRWRFQKNKKNGEIKNVVRSRRAPTRCPVAATIRILRRHSLASLPDTIPLAVFFTGPDTNLDSMRLINATHMNAFLQDSACRVFGFAPGSAEAHKYTTHSIRIGAAVALHANGAKNTVIFSLPFAGNTSVTFHLQLP